MSYDQVLKYRQDILNSCEKALDSDGMGCDMCGRKTYELIGGYVCFDKSDSWTLLCEDCGKFAKSIQKLLYARRSKFSKTSTRGDYGGILERTISLSPEVFSLQDFRRANAAVYHVGLHDALSHHVAIQLVCAGIGAPYERIIKLDGKRTLAKNLCVFLQTKRAEGLRFVQNVESNGQLIRKFMTRAEIRSEKRTWFCWNCDDEIDHRKYCGRCKTVWYCGRECQYKHWENHKKACVKLCK